MFKLNVYNQNGEEVKKLDLDPQVFDGKVNEAVLYQAVLMYRANQRKGLASTKTRHEVSGGGKKPWRQKGTGRARVSSIRSPLWRKGGIIFGPHPRDYSFRLPKKIRMAALKSSLNAKLEEKNIVIIEDINIEVPKTREAVKILSGLNLKNDSILLMTNNIEKNLKLSFANIKISDIINVSDVNAFDILKVKKIVITLKALNTLVERIKNKIEA